MMSDKSSPLVESRMEVVGEVENGYAAKHVNHVRLERSRLHALKTNLPVPVLAEPHAAKDRSDQARESTSNPKTVSSPGDSRGGQNPLSGGVESRHAQNQRSLMPKAKTADVKGLGGDILTESSLNQWSGSSAPPAQSLLSAADGHTSRTAIHLSGEERELLPATKPKRRLERNAEHQKYILKDGTEVGGCSGIAKLGESYEGLIRWANQMGLKGIDSSKFRDKTADIGSLSHFMASCFLDGVEPDLREYDETDIAKAKFGFDKFLSFWEREKLVRVASEKQLKSELYRYGGTLDIVARDESGLLVLCELKSSKAVYQSHKWQLGGQESLWNENYDEKISRRCILRIPPTGDGEFQVHWIPNEQAIKHIHVFRCQAALFNAIKGK